MADVTLMDFINHPDMGQEMCLENEEDLLELFPDQNSIGDFEELLCSFHDDLEDEGPFGVEVLHWLTQIHMSCFAQTSTPLPIHMTPRCTYR